MKAASVSNYLTTDMGQFLWLEEKNPDIPMLDIMCRFLMSARADFEWSEDDDPVRFQNFPGQ